MTSVELYWLLKLDALIVAASFLVLIFVLASFASYMVAEVQESEGEKKKSARSKKLCAFSMIFASCFFFVAVFLPSTKQAAVIYIAPKIANSEFVTDTLPNEAKELYGIAKSWLVEKAKQTEQAEKGN